MYAIRSYYGGHAHRGLEHQREHDERRGEAQADKEALAEHAREVIGHVADRQRRAGGEQGEALAHRLEHQDVRAGDEDRDGGDRNNFV